MMKTGASTVEYLTLKIWISVKVLQERLAAVFHEIGLCTRNPVDCLAWRKCRSQRVGSRRWKAVPVTFG